MPKQFVKPENLSNQFDFGNITASKITIKIDSSLITSPTTGELGLSAASLTIISPDAGNLVKGDANGKALFTQADLQAAETAFTLSLIHI